MAASIKSPLMGLLVAAVEPVEFLDLGPVHMDDIPLRIGKSVEVGDDVAILVLDPEQVSHAKHADSRLPFAVVGEDLIDEHGHSSQGFVDHSEPVLVFGVQPLEISDFAGMVLPARAEAHGHGLDYGWVFEQ